MPRLCPRGGGGGGSAISNDWCITPTPPTYKFLQCFELSAKDSKSRTKTNSSPALIRAYGRTYVRTDGRTDVTSKFSFVGLVRFIVFSVLCETKDLLMRQVSEHALSVLKSKSIVLRWKRVVSVLLPLSLFSRGGSHFC